MSQLCRQDVSDGHERNKGWLTGDQDTRQGYQTRSSNAGDQTTSNNLIECVRGPGDDVANDEDPKVYDEQSLGAYGVL